MKDLELTVREARPRDVPEIVDLVNHAYGRTDDPSGWTSEDDILEGPRIEADGVEELMKQEGSVVLAAEDEAADEVLGCVHLQRLEEGVSELGLLSVDPQRQAQGLGRRILEAGEAYAQDELGAQRIVLKVITVREELIAWYERRGYERTGEKQSFEPGGEQRSLRGPLAFAVLEKELG